MTGRPAWAERLWRWMDSDAPVWLMVAVETPMQRLMCRLWGHEWTDCGFAGRRVTVCDRCDR